MHKKRASLLERVVHRLSFRPDSSSRFSPWRGNQNTARHSQKVFAKSHVMDDLRKTPQAPPHPLLRRRNRPRRLSEIKMSTTRFGIFNAGARMSFPMRRPPFQSWSWPIASRRPKGPPVVARTRWWCSAGMPIGFWRDGLDTSRALQASIRVSARAIAVPPLQRHVFQTVSCSVLQNEPSASRPPKQLR